MRTLALLRPSAGAFAVGMATERATEVQRAIVAREPFRGSKSEDAPAR
jgi:hypothetical protein